MRRIVVALAMLVGMVGLLGIVHGGSARSSQEEAGDLAGHPFVGTWVAMTPAGPVPTIVGPDGSFVAAFTANYFDPGLGLTFQGSALGRWEADGERGTHFTAIQVLTDAEGTYLGTFQFEGHPEVSADGQTFTDTTPQRVVMRDANNTITFDQILPVEPPVTGVRLSPGGVDLPVKVPVNATPAA
jgi:hypothetical protein